MLRRIDIGSDKNLFVIDPKLKRQPELKFLADEIPKTPDEAVEEARKASWGNWINSEPLLIGHVTEETGAAYLFFISELLKKKVVLLEFVDFTLLPCRRSLSYSLEWNRRYGHSGLLVIAVHSPMFDFAKDKKLVMDAVRELGIPYPVVIDNDFALWKSVENRFWPRRILLDNKGKTHVDVAGEGSYEEFEAAIQLLLRELSPGLPCPPLLKPLRKIDDPDYAIPETSQEIFFGSKKSMPLGNATPFRNDNEEVAFKDDSQGTYRIGAPYLDGPWAITKESIFGTLHRGDVRMTTKFSGTDVYLVARARSKNPNDVPTMVRVQIHVDKKSLTEDKVSGTHAMLNEVRRSVLQAREPKLYHIATRLSPGLHELTLVIDEDPLHTLEIYGLFFEHNA
ncbi:MAG: hypothetical protein HY075_16790 [Deltaproteobacteria bacterium]|nr:hypothetical protein [Deltaproteobacteria bacterium]